MPLHHLSMLLSPYRQDGSGESTRVETFITRIMKRGRLSGSHRQIEHQ
jgi:hypothetical protein